MMQTKHYVSRFVGSFVGLSLLGVATGDPVSSEYATADKGFHRHCDGLDRAVVDELIERATIQYHDGWSKGKIGKDARQWCRQRDIIDDYRRCVAAIATLTVTPRTRPPETVPPEPLRTKFSDLPRNEQRYALASARLKTRRLAEIEKQLQWAKEYRDQLTARRGDRATRVSAMERIKQLEAEGAKAREDMPDPGLTPRIWAVGHLGTVRIWQIIDADTMFVEGLKSPAGTGGFTNFLQVSPSRTAFGPITKLQGYPSTRYLPAGKILLVKGIPTSRFVDDEIREFPQVVRIYGTERYTTVLGAPATVMAAEAVDIDVYKVRAWFRDGQRP